MTLHIRPRALAVLVVAVAVIGVSGCTRESSSGSPRIISPGMAEGNGHDVLYWESRDHVAGDLR